MSTLYAQHTTWFAAPDWPAADSLKVWCGSVKTQESVRALPAHQNTMPYQFSAKGPGHRGFVEPQSSLLPISARLFRY